MCNHILLLLKHITVLVSKWTFKRCAFSLYFTDVFVVKSKNFWVQLGGITCYKVFKERLNLWKLAWGKGLGQKFGHLKCIDQRESDKPFWLKVKRREMLVINGSLVLEEMGMFLLLIWHGFLAIFRPISWSGEVFSQNFKRRTLVTQKNICVWPRFCDFSLTERVISNRN